MSQNSSTETLKEVMHRWRLGGGKGSAALPASAVGSVGKAAPMPTTHLAGNSSSAFVADAAAEAWVDSQVLAAERAEEAAKCQKVTRAPQSSRTHGSFGGLLLSDLDQMDEDDDDAIDVRPAARGESQDAFNMLFAIPTVVRKSGACVTSRRCGNVERPRRSNANAAAEADVGVTPPAPSVWAFGLDSISGIPQAQSSKATPVSSAADHQAALGSKTPMVMKPYGFRQARAEEFFDTFALKASDVGVAFSPTAKSNEQLGSKAVSRERGGVSSRTVVGSRGLDVESGGVGDGQGLPFHSDGLQPVRGESRGELNEPNELSSSRNSKGPREVLDITALLEGPRPAGAEGATEEDTRRMSSLMDAPIDAFQPAVIHVVGGAAAGVAAGEGSGRRSGRGAGNDPAAVSVNATAAARHFAVPNSQHTATLRAMVRMLCCAFESFDVRLERSRAEEAEDRASYVERSSAGLTVLPPPPSVQSLRPSELEPNVDADSPAGVGAEADTTHEKYVKRKMQKSERGWQTASKIDAGKWRVFDAVLELVGGDDDGSGPREHYVYGHREDGQVFGRGWNGGGDLLRSVGQHGKGSASALGMIHRQCRIVGHRPLLRPESQVLDKVIKALKDETAEPAENMSDERKKMTSRARAALKRTFHHPVVALALAACLKGVVVSMLMPASHYEMLSLDQHRFFGLSLPFHCSLVLARSNSESPPCVSHIVIVPGLSVLPLPLRTLQGELGGQFGNSPTERTSDGHHDNAFVDDAAHRFEGELQMARSTAHEGFRFHANPLAPRAAHSSSPSKRESPRRSYGYNKDVLDGGEPAFDGSTAAGSRRSHSRPQNLRVEEESGFAFGPYPALRGEALVVGGDGQSIAADDWHVPLDTLEAILDAYTTQISQVETSIR